MEIKKEAIKQYKRVHKTCFGKDISDREALRRATHLLKMIYKYK